MEREQILVGDHLKLVRESGNTLFKCVCGNVLCSGKENFKDYCKVSEVPMATLGSGQLSWDTDMVSEMCFREFFCPSCGIRHATEIASTKDPYLWDIRLEL